MLTEAEIKAYTVDIPNDIQAAQRASGCASATGYAAWRAKAEIRLAEMERTFWERWREQRKLGQEISDLKHVMGNGASGGTAWTLHNY